MLFSGKEQTYAYALIASHKALKAETVGLKLVKGNIIKGIEGNIKAALGLDVKLPRDKKKAYAVYTKLLVEHGYLDAEKYKEVVGAGS